MKKIILVLFLLFGLSLPSFSESVTISWSVNDNSNIDGYIVTYTAESTKFSVTYNVGKNTSFTVGDLIRGECYAFIVSCYDKSRKYKNISDKIIYKVSPEKPFPELPKPKVKIVTSKKRYK